MKHEPAAGDGWKDLAARTRRLMLWEDLLLARALSDDELRAGVASAFAVPSEVIQIIDSVAEQPAKGDGQAQILLECWAPKGEFPLDVQVYLLTGELERRVDSREASLATVKALSRHWQCDCLVADETADPTAELLVRSDGSAELVELDADRLDEDEYVLRRSQRVG